MKEKIEYLVKKYHTRLIKNPKNSDEVYKWEAVQHFQENWNIDSVDFYKMFNESFRKKANLVYQNSYGFLDKLGKVFPDKLNEFFQIIYTEKDVDFYEKLKNGKYFAEEILSSLKDKLGKEVLNHQFDERTLSFLLFLRFPHNHTIFKVDVYEQLCNYLEIGEEENKYDHFISLLKQISDEAEKTITTNEKSQFISQDLDFPLLFAQDIVYQELISSPKNAFIKTLNLLPQCKLNIYFDFLDEIISKLSLSNSYNQVFSVTDNTLKYHIGKRICFALNKYGFSFITDSQTELDLAREEFTNPTNAYLYHNGDTEDLISNKENIINAIKEEIRLDRETYKKNYDNAYFRKSVFNLKYRAKIFNNLELISFESLDKLINKVNSDLGSFCKAFQMKKKELFAKKRMNSPNQLLAYSDGNRDWAINEGGGIELQYHLYLRDNEIGYGLGFNTQYVPFANDMTPQEYMKPFALSYLNQPLVQNSLLDNGFSFIIGSKEELINLEYDNYVLIGKCTSIYWNEETKNYELSNYWYRNMINEMKGVLFQNYIDITSKRNEFKTYNVTMEKHLNLLKYKKQIILQGPPGTGKTREAKLISKDILGVDSTDDLMASQQFKLIQFHPSYTYEDFVRGIVAESKGEKIEYKNANKTLGSFADKALKNFENSKKVPELISKELWVQEQYIIFKEYLESELEKSGELLIKNDTKPKITAIEVDAIRVNRYSNESDSVLIKDNDIIIGYIGLHLSETILKVKDNSALSKSARSGMYYLYQNLIEKFREFLDKQNLSYRPTEDAKAEELKNYVLIIDEINRANLSSVLGELIYALEYRGEEVESMYEVDGSQKLILPPNLYIIGTMNTADRSVGHIDYAIRRRFAFVDVLPKELKDDKIIFHQDWFRKVSGLFIENYDEYIADDKVALKRAKTLSGEFRPEDVWIGHSYFIQKKLEDDSLEPDDFRIRVDYEIKPILLEYVKDGVLVGKVDDKIAVEDYIKSL